jgi:hypothetical protein
LGISRRSESHPPSSTAAPVGGNDDPFAELKAYFGADAPPTVDALSVLSSSTCAVVIEVCNAAGALIYKSDVFHPTWGSGFSSSEENALKAMLAAVPRFGKGFCVRLFTALHPWTWIWRRVLVPFLERLDKAETRLVVVDCRLSDDNLYTSAVLSEVFKGKKGHAVVRCEARAGQPHFSELFELVSARGDIFLDNLAREWDPHNFGHADLSGPSTIANDVQAAAKAGAGTNLLVVDAALALRVIDEQGWALVLPRVRSET